MANNTASVKISKPLHHQAKKLSLVLGIKLQEVIDRSVTLMLHRHKGKLGK